MEKTVLLVPGGGAPAAGIHVHNLQTFFAHEKKGWEAESKEGLFLDRLQGLGHTLLKNTTGLQSELLQNGDVTGSKSRTSREFFYREQSVMHVLGVAGSSAYKHFFSALF